jgi:hypothetical protein
VLGSSSLILSFSPANVSEMPKLPDAAGFHRRGRCEIVCVRATDAAGASRCRSNRCLERCWNLKDFAAPGPELGQRCLPQPWVSTPWFEVKEAIYATKQDRALQRRPSPILALARLMPSDQELIRPARSKQFDSHQDWSHHDGMNPVHAQRVDQLQVDQRFAILSGESHVPTHLHDGTA